MYFNRIIQELSVINFTFTKATTIDACDRDLNSPTAVSDVLPIEEIKENSSLQKLKLSVGSMATIKPLIRCFVTFKNVRKLEISNCILSKLHFMTIDNYIV